MTSSKSHAVQTSPVADVWYVDTRNNNILGYPQDFDIPDSLSRYIKGKGYVEGRMEHVTRMCKVTNTTKGQSAGRQRWIVVMEVDDEGAILAEGKGTTTRLRPETEHVTGWENVELEKDNVQALFSRKQGQSEWARRWRLA